MNEESMRESWQLAVMSKRREWTWNKRQLNVITFSLHRGRRKGQSQIRILVF